MRSCLSNQVWQMRFGELLATSQSELRAVERCISGSKAIRRVSQPW